MLGSISLASGVLRWWIAPLAYVGSMAVLMGVSSSGLPPELGQASVFVCYTLLASAMVLIFAKANAKDDLGISKSLIEWNVLLVAVGGAVIAILLGELAGFINQDIATSTKTILTNIGFGESDLTDLLIIATICCLAPLGEEALYRGLIFRGIFNSLRAPFLAVLGPWSASIIAATLASIVFAFSHGGEGQEASVIVVIFLSGLVYGLCYALTGSLWAAILAHSVNNTVALAIFAFPSESVSLLSKVAIALAPLLSAAFVWAWARVLPR